MNLKMRYLASPANAVVSAINTLLFLSYIASGDIGDPVSQIYLWNLCLISIVVFGFGHEAGIINSNAVTDQDNDKRAKNTVIIYFLGIALAVLILRNFVNILICVYVLSSSVFKQLSGRFYINGKYASEYVRLVINIFLLISMVSMKFNFMDYFNEATVIQILFILPLIGLVYLIFQERIIEKRLSLRVISTDLNYYYISVTTICFTYLDTLIFTFAEFDVSQDSNYILLTIYLKLGMLVGILSSAIFRVYQRILANTWEASEGRYFKTIKLVERKLVLCLWLFAIALVTLLPNFKHILSNYFGLEAIKVFDIDYRRILIILFYFTVTRGVFTDLSILNLTFGRHTRLKVSFVAGIFGLICAFSLSLLEFDFLTVFGVSYVAQFSLYRLLVHALCWRVHSFVSWPGIIHTLGSLLVFVVGNYWYT